jgi:glycerol-1-phosphate dehydrogenase [NAD(P)+]
MFDLQKIKEEFSNCDCGMEHELTIKDVAIGSGITLETGEILKRNGFKKRLLFVADNNTLKAADGVLDALKDFDLTLKIYDNLREATIREVNVLKELLKDNDGIIAVGTGSLHDISRKAAADSDKPLCLFATAASMDGFASYGAPLTDGNFKATYSAKSPEVIIADTKILAAAPAELKSAGFGDMVGKYVGLIDWQVSSLITGEYYCEKVAKLTRDATDRIMALSNKILANDEDSAVAVFEALLLTGIGMSFTKTSRPASGTEHILSHFWECKKLLEGKLSDFHGKKVGVTT